MTTPAGGARFTVRPATPADVDALVQVWHEGWHDAHDDCVPPELVALRTLASFRPRMEAMLTDVRLVELDGAPAGFSRTRDDELQHLFLSRVARGTGIAATLIHEVETRVASRGFASAWLTCAIGNLRAARFYEKHGWRRVRTERHVAETEDGGFPLDVWRYEIMVRRPSGEFDALA